MTPAPLTSSGLRRLLRERYPASAWALFHEVANTTGFADNYLDVVAVSLWRSHGIALHGFEIKVTRSDWLRELKDPKKSDAVAKYLDYFWLCVADPAIVHPGELPTGWGLLAPVQRKGVAMLRAITPAKLIVGALPLDRAVFAALCRRAAAGSRDAEELTALRAELDRETEAEVERRTKRRAEELATLRNWIVRFEQASGVTLSTYERPERIGAAVKHALAADYRNPAAALEHAATTLANIADLCRADAQTLRATLPPFPSDDDSTTL